jgi:ATP-dependent Clp protease adaptor protein ClpS
MPDTQTLPKPTVEESTDEKKQNAPLWKVIIHNDDKTTMDFVVWILMRFFAQPIEEATKTMLSVHETGQGIAGVYPREIAELKRDQAVSAARTKKFPLTLTIEADE